MPPVVVVEKSPTTGESRWPLTGTDNQVPQQLCIHCSLGERIMCESRVSQSREGDSYGKGYHGTC